MPYARNSTANFMSPTLITASVRDADADADFVQQHTAHLELSCTIQRTDVPCLVKQWKLSVEAAARRARYQFFEDICAQIGATKVALGHHRDDTAETVLMNLFRGSGSTGLKGIAPVRDFQIFLAQLASQKLAVKSIRPLSEFTRQQIDTFSCVHRVSATTGFNQHGYPLFPQSYPP